jgi:deoxyribose-phosphate aldolase
VVRSELASLGMASDDDTPSVEQFCALVDHTILKPEAAELDIRAVCDEARQLQTASVCVNSSWVRLAVSELRGSGVPTCSVVGFPLGASNSRGLVAEIGGAIEDGAAEIDMVLPVGLVKSVDWGAVETVLAAARQAAVGVVLKVILETALLTDDELVAACNFAVDTGADFVKTSTGFHSAGGATGHAVELMRATVGPDIGVKASGGIRTLDDVRTMIAAGANRLGMSATVAVAKQLGDALSD